MNKTDIFTERLEEFLITQPEIEWELEKQDYGFLMDYSAKLGLLMAVSSAFSFLDTVSSIIEITQMTISKTIEEIGLSCQSVLIEKIEKDFE